jgi:hypothetical protein
MTSELYTRHEPLPVAAGCPVGENRAPDGEWAKMMGSPSQTAGDFPEGR